MKSLNTLISRMGFFLAAQSDDVAIDLLCIRPESSKREFPETILLDAEKGVIGDRWLKHPSACPDDQRPDPNVQISILPARIYREICLIDSALYPGDTVIADLDCSEENLPVGQRLKLGEAVIEVGNIPNYGCVKWAQRYGDDALRFVSRQDYQPYRLRGVLCKIIQNGQASIGDRISKI